jgi:hypothetical protein
VEPARRRPAVGQVPPWRAGPGGRAPAHRLGRAAGARPGQALRHRRRAGRDRGRARRVRGAGGAGVATRTPGRELGGDPARAPTSSSPTTCARPSSSWRRTSAPAWTASARRPCSIRTGTRRRRRPIAWAPRSARCSIPTSGEPRAGGNPPPASLSSSMPLFVCASARAGSGAKRHDQAATGRPADPTPRPSAPHRVCTPR